MSAYDYDLFVIGAGSGGVRASRMAAGKGKTVAVAEERYLGGTCVNVGCVPKKLMVYASHFAEDFHDAAGFGWQVGECTHDWPTLIANKDKEIARLNGIYQNLLESAGVEIINGRARLVDAHTVEVAGKQYTAEKILLTVGCTPILPAVPGIEHCINSDQVFYLPEKPERVVIVGAGYIAVEFAGIFNGLGCETHIVYRGDRLLRNFDRAIGAFVSAEMEKKGIHIHYLAEIESIERDSKGTLACALNDGKVLHADQVMYATGRRALTEDLGLAEVGVASRENQSIIVNDDFQTNIPSIYALGDVIGTPELTPVALAQAMVFVDHQYGEKQRSMSYDAIPTAVFCQPNIGSVGLSEEQVHSQGIVADVYTSEFRHLKHTLSGNSERVLMKMLVRQDNQQLLGVHMVGPDAGEIIQGFAVAVKAGLTKQQVDETIGIHPTAAEELVTLREIKYRVNNPG